MNFEWDEVDMQLCQDVYNTLEPEEALFMSHYELARETSIEDSTVWKKFLTQPQVKDWLESETTLFNQTQIRKLYKKAATDSKSPGTAQMINALDKTLEKSTTKDGPVFVYCYVPLNVKEQEAPNIQMLNHDIFYKGE